MRGEGGPEGGVVGLRRGRAPASEPASQASKPKARQQAGQTQQAQAFGPSQHARTPASQPGKPQASPAPSPTHLGVLVRLGPVVLEPVHHRHVAGQARQVPEVGLGRHIARERVGVARDRADDDAARLLVGRGLEVLQQQVGQQEVAQVVGADRQLKAVGRVRGLLGRGLVDGGIADERVQAAARGLEGGGKLADRLQGGQVQVHDAVAALGHADLLRQRRE